MKRLDKTEFAIFVLLCVLYFQRQPFKNISGGHDVSENVEMVTLNVLMESLPIQDSRPVVILGVSPVYEA